MNILAIETSCDETAVAILKASGSYGVDFQFSVLGNALYSQVAIHVPYGGVFPNLAKREHQLNLVPLLTTALSAAGLATHGSTSIESEHMDALLEREPELLAQLVVFLQSYARPDIDAIAVTAGPGLEPALWVGINFAKALSLVWNIPIVAVNHMEGHIMASLVQSNSFVVAEFPSLTLLVSGGHTELVEINEWMHYEILGETRDDAAGEAFDKIARLLGLPYPGGPELSRLAHEARIENLPHEIELPRPMIHDTTYDFSFSGLKTAVQKLVAAHSPLSDTSKRAYAREAEDAIVEVLVSKTLRAAEEYGVSTIIVGGGVSANTHLRDVLNRAASRSGISVLFPSPELATDNAIMIGLAGYFRAQKSAFADTQSLQADGNLRLA